MEILKLILDWFKKNAVLLLGSLAVFVMFVCFVSGCNYHKNHSKCPEITTNTVIIHDTIIYQIADTIPFYIQKTDTIIYTETIIQPVDTAEILKNYFALHVYNRHWEDSLLSVNLRDTVTQNRFMGNDFNYRILRPQTIINTIVDNSVKYNSCLYFGLDIFCPNMEYSEIALFYASRKSLLGIGYAPLAKGGSFKIALPLFTWQ